MADSWDVARRALPHLTRADERFSINEELYGHTDVAASHHEPCELSVANL